MACPSLVQVMTGVSGITFLMVNMAGSSSLVISPLTEANEAIMSLLTVSVCGLSRVRLCSVSRFVTFTLSPLTAVMVRVVPADTS